MGKLLVYALALSLGAVAAEAKELRLSMAPPPNSPWGGVTQKFVDKVAELSGGDLTIKAFMGSKLGGEQDGTPGKTRFTGTSYSCWTKR